MLELIRKYSKSIVVKIFLTILSTSFLIYFGFSLIVDKLQGKDYVVKVGDIKIPPQVFKYARDKKYNAARGRQDKNNKKEDKDISKSILQQMIWENIISLAAEEFGIIVGDETMFHHISNMEYFRKRDGHFDAQKLRKFLSVTEMSEKEFIKSSQREIKAHIMQVPYKYISLMDEFKYYIEIQNERRKIRFIEIDPSTVKLDKEATDADLDSYYNDNNEEFEIPEKRSFKLLIMPMDKIEATVKIEEDELIEKAQDFYGEDYDEKKSVRQYKATDDYKDLLRTRISEEAESITREIEDNLVSGVSLEETIEKYQLKTMEFKDVTLDDKDKVKLPYNENVLNTAFGLDEEEIGNFNEAEEKNKKRVQWLVYVTNIVPKSLAPLAKVKDKVREGWIKAQKHEKAEKIADDIIMKTKIGGDFAELVKPYNYKVIETSFFDRGANIRGDKSKFDEAREKEKEKEREKNKNKPVDPDAKEEKDPIEEMYKASFDDLLNSAARRANKDKILVYQVCGLQYEEDDKNKDIQNNYVQLIESYTDDMFQQLIGYFSRKYDVRINYDKLKQVDEMIDIDELQETF